MHIAFINATKRWGGVKTWMLEFAKHLFHQGHTIRIYGRQPEFIRVAQEYVGHGEKVSFGPDLNPVMISWFLKEFQKHCIDIVIINVGKDLSTAGVAARLANIPVIQRVGLPHDIPYSLKTRLLHLFVRPLFLCPCQYIADGLVKALSYIGPQHVKVVLNGKEASKSPLKNHTPRRFVCTQQLEANKGHLVLLEAFSQISEPFELHIWGEGAKEQALKKSVHTFGLTKHVFFHGFSTNIIDALQEGDIFLLASMSEGLPNTLLEAMAVGLLPITRLVGGVDEVLTPKLRSWALPYNAGVEDFQRNIRRALELSREELLELQEHAREACQDSFNIHTQVAELEAWLLGVTRGEH